MRVLFLAVRLNPDHTSGGLQCCKMIKILLNQESNQIDVLSLDSSIGKAFGSLHALLEGSNIINPETSYIQRKCINAFGFAKQRLTFLHSKLNALSVYLTGFNWYDHLAVWIWRRNIAAILKSNSYDLIFCRGAGHDFNCHIAMTRIRTHVPWVAYYHDPFPLSNYPDPYRIVTPIISKRQEFVNKVILRKATHVAFPSRRIADWQMDASGVVRQPIVIPHPGINIEGRRSAENPVEIQSTNFNLVHTGTLLTPRDPRALLRAFLTFLRKDVRRVLKSRLIFVGMVNKEHKQYPEWDLLLETGCLILHQSRISYEQSVNLSANASVLISLEAIGDISPFFPGKLSDYIMLDKPILALAPANSTILDLLGKEYPYWSKVDDEIAIENKIEMLWLRWNEDPNMKMGRSDLREHIGSIAINRTFDKLLAS